MIYYAESNSNKISGKFLMAVNRFNMDMCNGPLLGKMIRYAIPLLFTYILQYAFQAADMLIIGNCGTYESLAAIGTTADLNSLNAEGLEFSKCLLKGEVTEEVSKYAEFHYNISAFRVFVKDSILQKAKKSKCIFS